MDELGKRPEELAATLAQAYDDTVEALGSALELRDAETYDHCQRVRAFTISIAKAVPVPIQYSWIASLNMSVPSSLVDILVIYFFAAWGQSIRGEPAP